MLMLMLEDTVMEVVVVLVIEVSDVMENVREFVEFGTRCELMIL